MLLSTHEQCIIKCDQDFFIFTRSFLVQTLALRLAFAPPGYPHLPQFPVSLPILQTTIYNSVNTRNCEFLVVLLYFDICLFFYASSYVTVKLAP